MTLSRAAEAVFRAQHTPWNARHVRFLVEVMGEMKTGAVSGATGASAFDAGVSIVHSRRCCAPHFSMPPGDQRARRSGTGR